MASIKISQRRQPSKTCVIVTPPGDLPFEVEFSVHEPPNSFRKTDIEPTFPDAVSVRHQPLFCVVTFQLANYIFGIEENDDSCSTSRDTDIANEGKVTQEVNTFSMISTDDRTIGYKDVARERYFYFMKKLKTACEVALEEISPASTARSASESSNASASPCAWVDWTDPATGLPILGQSGPSTYCESDALEQLMACDIVVVAGNGGACRMVQHDRWGIEVYPATGFVSVPSFQVLQRGFDIMLNSPEVKVVPTH